jgi:light-regulated signal transduction histidine kinase (bacteriophytochrome)
MRSCGVHSGIAQSDRHQGCLRYAVFRLFPANGDEAIAATSQSTPQLCMLPNRLTPRASFDAWSETVRGQSEPWSATQVAASRALAMALVKLSRSEASGTARPSATEDVDLRVADALAAAQNAEETSRQLVKTLALLSESLASR